MSANDLTTLDRVKEWVGSSVPNNVSPASDALIRHMIKRMSIAMLNEMSRDSMLVKARTDTYDGKGTQRMTIAEFPVLSVSSLIISNMKIAAGPPNGVGNFISQPGAGGYYYEAWDGVPSGRPQMIGVNGACFARGLANVTLSYVTGYGVLSSPQVVPATAPYQLSIYPAYGLLSGDYQVTYANGTVLTPVAANPSSGQYVPPSPFADFGPSSVYTFAAADAGANILVSYSFVPSDVEGACVEWAAERLAYRTRIGQRSKSLGGQETVSFDIKAIPDFVKNVIKNYKNIVTLW